MTKDYDILVIGGGPGGYTAAIRASQLGFKVALIEAEKVGGVCLNKGCVPSKSFIKSSNLYNTINKSKDYGILCDNISLDFNQVKKRTDNIVEKLHGGVKSLLSKNKVDVYYHNARLMGASIFSPLPGSISIPAVNKEDENTIVIAKNIILAVGTKISVIGGLEPDHNIIIDSDDALKLDSLPKSITIVGAGIIGVEWASMLNNFGVDVTLVERGEAILATEDKDIINIAHKSLEKRGVKIFTNVEINTDKTVKTEKNISIEINHNNKNTKITSDKLLVAVGRSPNTQNIGLENTKITLDDRGFIKVDEDFRTKEKHIFAIGDVNGFMPLAHSASAQGVYVVEYLKGISPTRINKNNIPKCIYITPEIASIGLTEQEAKQQGFDIKIAKFNTSVNSKAIIEGETEGVVKIISDNISKDILGIHVIGADATNLIGEASLAKFLDATALEIGKTIHPHPSLTENIMEAALDIENQAIHK